MTKHTPGPWTSNSARDIKQKPVRTVRQSDGNMIIATCSKVNDARLIAAAPELLECIKDAEFIIRKLSINPNEIGAVLDSLKRSASDLKQAIAKAEGKGENNE